MMKIEWNIFCTRAKTTNDNHFKELEGFNECVGGLCMIIRQEQYADYDEVYELVKTSFATSTNEGEWDYFNRGIARALMMKAFQIAKHLGYTAVFLCGEPNFYHKIGFKPSYEYGIFHVADKTKNAEWCMALELIPGVLAGKSGTINIQ